jgi:hypothetical protein
MKLQWGGCLLLLTRPAGSTSSRQIVFGGLNYLFEMLGWRQCDLVRQKSKRHSFGRVSLAGTTACMCTCVQFNRAHMALARLIYKA